MTDKSMIKAYVSPESKEFIEGLAKYSGISVSKVVQLALVMPGTYLSMLQEYKKEVRIK